MKVKQDESTWNCLDEGDWAILHLQTVYIDFLLLIFVLTVIILFTLLSYVGVWFC